MRIIVPIKQVPETNAVKMDDQTGTMIREGVEAIINPLDLYAIECAIRLREARDDCEVIAISMGPPRAVTALKEAISMGVDSAVLICDEAFAGSDTLATAYVLSAAIRKLGDFDLIVCGERATDGDTGQVGPGVASFLDIPAVTYVSRIDSVEDGLCRTHRLVEDGYEVLEMSLPGLLTVVKEVADPRLPTLRGKQRARRSEIPIWRGDDLDTKPDLLGLAGSPTRVVKIFRPSVSRQCEKFIPTDERDLDEATDRLVEFLQERGLV